MLLGRERARGIGMMNSRWGSLRKTTGQGSSWEGEDCKGSSVVKNELVPGRRATQVRVEK